MILQLMPHYMYLVIYSKLMPQCFKPLTQHTLKPKVSMITIRHLSHTCADGSDALTRSHLVWPRLGLAEADSSPSSVRQHEGCSDRNFSADLLYRSSSFTALLWLTITWVQGIRYLKTSPHHIGTKKKKHQMGPSC